MLNTFRVMFAVTAAFALAILTPAVAGAQNFANRDANEIAGYMLTDAVVPCAARR